MECYSTVKEMAIDTCYKCDQRKKASLRDCILFDFIYYPPNDLTMKVEMKEIEMEKTEMNVEGDGCDYKKVV